MKKHKEFSWTFHLTVNNAHAIGEDNKLRFNCMGKKFKATFAAGRTQRC